MATLAEQLGYSSDDRLLIVNCDDLGMSHAANEGCFRALRSGIATSATLMVPCPWARAAAADLDGEDVGVHLTLNSEYDRYRWGPITHAPSLLDGDGGFPRTVEDAWDHADLDEVRRECRAQIERAMLWGVDVTHLDSHMGTLQLRPEFFDIYLDMALEFRLPLRMAGASVEHTAGFPFRHLAAEEGVVFPDWFVYVGGVGSREAIERVVANLRPGVTELYVHPAIDTPELRAIDDGWASRVDDLELMAADGPVARTLVEHDVVSVGWSGLRDLMRS
ncbi:MAG: polysaccharide deacetylase family protein [Acidimicrobiales bacterium]